MLLDPSLYSLSVLSNNLEAPTCDGTANGSEFGFDDDDSPVLRDNGDDLDGGVSSILRIFEEYPTMPMLMPLVVSVTSLLLVIVNGNVSLEPLFGRSFRKRGVGCVSISVAKVVSVSSSSPRKHQIRTEGLPSLVLFPSPSSKTEEEQ